MIVGFIGLGTMGRPMASNILKRGFSLVAYDVDPDAVQALSELGAEAAESVAALASRADVIITMLPKVSHVKEVVSGPSGIVGNAKPGTVVIQMSTIDPGSMREVAGALEAGGYGVVDAPVGKSSDAAKDGTLSIMAGGEAATIERVRPVLECIGSQITVCGPAGAGSSMKLINNLLSATILSASCEAIQLARRSGINTETLFSILGSTAARNGHLEMTLPSKVLADDVSPGFKVSLAHKDLRLAMTMVAELGVPAFVSAATQQLFALAMQRGHGELDWTSVLQLMDELE